MNEKEPSRVGMIVGGIFNIAPALLALLMPLFFLATASEFFEFNKLMLLSSATLILLLATTFRMIESKKIGITKSMVDLPYLLFVLSIVLSTIFSINKTTSIFGSQGRWFPSLFGILVLYAFYYLINGSINKKSVIKTAIYMLIIGSTISTVIAILGYYNIFIGSASYLRIPGFTLTGSTTTTLVLAALTVVLSFAAMMYESNAAQKALLLVSAVINYFLVVLLNGIPAWVILGVGVISIVFFINYRKIMENTMFLTMAAGTLAAITLVVFLPTTRDLLTNSDYPKELSLPARESWVIASQTVQDYPTLATGPSSFSLNFPRYRPLSLNNGDFWNVRFDKPYNEIFNILATVGLVGLLTATFLGYRMLKLIVSSLKTHDEDGLAKILGIASLSLIAIYFVTYATVLNSFLMVLLFALLVANLGIVKAGSAEFVTVNLASIAPVTTIGEEGAIRKEFLQYIFALPLVAVTVYTGYIMYKTYAAEYFLRMSIVAATNNEGAKTFEYQTKAINMNPRRDTYHNAYAQTNLALANSIASKEDLNDTDRQTIQQLIAQSIRNSRLSTEVINPLNVDNWTTRATVYRAIAPIAQNASQWAIASYNTAIQLSPTDPRLRLDLGGIYYSLGDYLTAANFYRQAILLKQDYANAHFNFAQALLKLEDYKNAKSALEITRALVDKDSNDYKIVEEQLANLPGQETGSGLPTVEEIEKNQPAKEQAAPAVQEPLTNPAQTQPQGNLKQEVLPTEQQPAQ